MTANDALQFSSIIVTFGSATYSDYCTTVVEPVAEVGGKKYETLTDAVAAATEENNIVTLLADIDLGTAYVNIDKAVTIKGEDHTITSAAAQAVLLTGNGAFTLENTKVSATKGHGIQAGSSNTAYAGQLTMDGSMLTVAKRGIRVFKENTGFGIEVNNSTIQSTKEDPTTTYTTGDDAMAMSLGATDGKGYEVNVTNSILQGFSYLLNAVTSGSNLAVNMTGGKTYGRAAVNNWGSNNTFTLDGVEIHGLNNQTGPTEGFACIVDNDGAQNNNFILKDCHFTGTLSEAAMTTTGSTASEHMLMLNGTNATVKVLGSTTYTCNSNERGGLVYNEGALFTNKLYFDDTAKATFADAFKEAVIAEEKDAEVGLYPVSFVPEVYYYWAVEGGYKGGYYNFAEPFENGWLADGEFIALQKDITLTKNIACQLGEGTSFNFLLGDYNVTKGEYSVSLNTGVTVLTDKQTDIFKAAKAGYKIVESTIEEGYSYTAQLSAPIIFHDEGTYEDALTVAMAGEGTIKYTLKIGDAEQTYTYAAPFTISETTTVKAWTELDGATSDVVTREYKIVEKAKGAVVEDGYYTIKNNGNGKYVNVAGRKTVTFESETADKAGTVIRVKTNDKGQVEVLRSQGVDVPGYADKAMRYVPKIVQLVAEKLGAEGEGKLLGKDGLGKIMDKFNESFDYHLYLEKAGDGYRIYGRTPSMKPVVDFYAENKANVDAKLPQLEAFINSAIDKVLEKTGNRGQSILVDFDLHDVWQNMPGKLTEPTDESSTLKFYEEVLSSETNVWNFAYETAMIYWGNVKEHPKFEEYRNKLGDYAKYIDKVENIRPNFRYYIVQKDNKLDIISEGNGELNADFTAWTLIPRTDFSVAFNEENVLNNKYYTTLYTDFAYTLPEGEGVKAYKVTEVSKAGVAKKVEMEGTIPAQTPVLLESESAEAQTLLLSTEDSTAPTDNRLVGADALINQYPIKTAQVEALFDMAKNILGESFYNTYIQEYEHLMARNAGTVNNKYFFGLDDADLDLCVVNKDCVVRNLGTGDNQPLAFYGDWQAPKANQAFLVSEKPNPILLMLKGDVNRSGDVTVADVNALVEIVLGKVTEPDDTHDFDAAHVNADEDITIADVTALVNIILGKTQN